MTIHIKALRLIHIERIREKAWKHEAIKYFDWLNMASRAVIWSGVEKSG